MTSPWPLPPLDPDSDAGRACADELTNVLADVRNRLAAANAVQVAKPRRRRSEPKAA